jgi:phage baseplate assembly protein W
MATPNTSYYSGISFPPRRGGKTGFWQVSTDADLIKENIYVLLNTRKGEMPMSPDFGTSIDDSLFDSVDKTMQGILCQQIQNDLESWEPRVTVNSVSAYSYENTRLFNIDLTIKLTGQQFSTSVPFNS